jgi:uncharacterized Tic20 family protein
MRVERGEQAPMHRGLAVLAHAGLAGPWILLPLAIRVTVGRSDEFVKHHSTEALNFMLTLTIVSNAFAVLAFFVRREVNFEWWQETIVVWIGAGLIFVTAVVFMVIGAWQAFRCTWWRYPINIRFVRGARPPATVAVSTGESPAEAR